MIVLGVKVSQKNKKLSQSLTEKLGLGNQVARIIGDIQYIGGHPMHPKSGTAEFTFYEQGFSMLAGGKMSALKYSTLKSVDVMDQTQISKDVTLTRLIALGIFAFGAKKKTVVHDTYVKFVFVLKGIENTVLIKSNQAGNIASRLNAGRISIAK